MRIQSTSRAARYGRCAASRWCDRAGQPIVSSLRSRGRRRAARDEAHQERVHPRTRSPPFASVLSLLLGSEAQSLPPNTRPFLDIANGNCERLIWLVNDLLDIDEIASGRMHFELGGHPWRSSMPRAVRSNEADAQHFNAPGTEGADRWLRGAGR
jgi:signal transduction histidine kinase